MEIILVEQVKNLGNIGDVVNVKAGFARNYLIPNSKALHSTEDNIAYFEAKKSEIEKANKSQIKEAQEFSTNVEGAIITIAEQAGEDGRLYGSVSVANISDALSKKIKQEISRKQIVLHSPIKYIGIHTIEVDLHAEVTVKVSVNVARTEAEAKEAEKKFKRGETVMEGPGAIKQDEYEEEVAAPSEKAAKSEKVEKTEASDEA